MEGSSESAGQNSDSSRGLNTSRVSNRNPRVHRAGRFVSSGEAFQDSDLRKERDNVVVAHTDDLTNQGGLSGVCEDEVAVDRFVRAIEWGDVSLRQWLDKPDRSVDVFECLHVFRQIVEIVNVAHSQGIVVHNVRPSCFVMSSFNRISFIESASCSDSGTDSPEDELNSPTEEIKDFHSLLHPRESLVQESENRIRDRNVELEDKRQPFPMKQILLMETSWYTSPEEVSAGSSSCASDIYRLGVLLFELFCPLSSREEKSRTMSSLRHRVLPPQLLLKWPKEASFCLWLLHPEPNSRPKMCELQQSEFLNEPRVDLEEREAAIELREKIEEQELLLEFLLLIQQGKQESADKLQNTLSFLCCDIDEVMKHQITSKKKGSSIPQLVKEDDSTSSFPSMNIIDDDDSASGSRKRSRTGIWVHNVEESDDNLDGQKTFFCRFRMTKVFRHESLTAKSSYSNAIFNVIDIYEGKPLKNIVCKRVNAFMQFFKNFVGLSVSDGYIATGSETNEVFIYHKAFPMPALSYKFQNTDSLSGHDTDDAAQFISSVCWRGQTSTLIAANSTGNIKILEMV
ncbi:hypothetical protein C1H46_003897 [Malus baccata]|uniref:Protein kinase domain-containing protein n=1 Tax=Malus baccata TaxID=106549 RepID=A0A540NHC5_MALBA|nr:hypothetical protein C1H46_003897 [Malus baccata]